MHIDIEVNGGVVRGESEGDLAVFRGIPYAALPVRFGAPQPVAAWGGVREALRFGPPPPQSGAFGADALVDGGDDWLTVNVWSPDLRGRFPVMVWIQGGAYTFGISGLAEYDGSNLARCEVVVVTFNYRVGLEGFGYIEGTPANRGLLDQVAALEWVRDNIGAFGGDPDRVTVFGQSAGGGSVAALLAMPRAAGLFHRAIAQSVPGTFFTPGLAADITRACAAELGLEPAELSTVDPRLLPAAGDAVTAKMGQFADRWGRAAYALIPFAPVVDGDVLPTTPWLGLTGEVELMVGHTRDEQRLLTALSGLLGEITEAQASEAAEIFGPDPQPLPGELSRPRGTVRGGAFGLALPDAVAEARRGAARGGWRGVPLRADLARPRHGWRARRLSRPGRAAGVRQPHLRSAGDVDRRPHVQRQQRCQSRCATRGRRLRPAAIPAGPPMTPARRGCSTSSRPSPPTPSRYPARSGGTTRACST